MRNLTSILMTLIFSLFLCYPAVASLDDDSSGDDDPSKPIQHIMSGLDLYSAISFRENAKLKFAAKSIYPQLQGSVLTESSNEFDQLITTQVDEEIERFKAQVEANKINLPDTLKNKTNTLYIDYDSAIIHPHNNFVISIRLSMQSYLVGNAHPTHLHRTLNYDLTNGNALSFTDLFQYGSDYLAVLSAYCQTIISHKLPNTEMIMQGTAPLEENYKNWNLHANGLLITFEPYQVAPGVYGAQTVLVPYSALQTVIDSDSIIGDCVKSAKKCRSDMLTGGFHS